MFYSKYMQLERNVPARDFFERETQYQNAETLFERRTEAQRTCLLHRAKFYIFLLNKCIFFAKRLLPSNGVVGRLLLGNTTSRSLPGVFQVASRAPKSFTTCETSSHKHHLLDLRRGLRVLRYFHEYWFRNLGQSPGDKCVKDFGVNNVCTLF